jgi:predicted nucleic acid-binding protein
VTLIDTSVWIDHLRSPNARLIQLLHEENVETHPFVLGELLLGNVAWPTFRELQSLPMAPRETDEEVVHFIQQRGLRGRGIGYLDAHLLASALLGRTTIWSKDARLDAAARSLGLAFDG